MSSLTEQERLGLEEVFLSISSSRNVLHKISSWRQNVSLLLQSQKLSLPFTVGRNHDFWIKNALKKDKLTKLFNKIQKRRKI